MEKGTLLAPTPLFWIIRMGRLLKGRGSQKTCLDISPESLRVWQRPRQAFVRVKQAGCSPSDWKSLKGFFYGVWYRFDSYAVSRMQPSKSIIKDRFISVSPFVITGLLLSFAVQSYGKEVSDQLGRTVKLTLPPSVLCRWRRVSRKSFLLWAGNIY